MNICFDFWVRYGKITNSNNVRTKKSLRGKKTDNNRFTLVRQRPYCFVIKCQTSRVFRCSLAMFLLLIFFFANNILVWFYLVIYLSGWESNASCRDRRAQTTGIILFSAVHIFYSFPFCYRRITFSNILKIKDVS